jgi:hypothetical protein
MPPIQNEVLRFDFDRAVTLKLFLFEQEEERHRREWSWDLARAQAQMTAAMMWCKHEKTKGAEGGLRCRGCGAMFRDEEE